MLAHRLYPKASALFLLLLCALAAPAQSSAPPPTDEHTDRVRLIVISDIGNEPDDQMSLIRLLLYSNELEIEGLIAATSTWQRAATHPETMHALVHAYGDVRPNLLLHATGWPTAADLDAKIAVGQPAYGMAATGPDHHSAGSDVIIRAVDQDDRRPLWICLWGGANTLAQALIEVKTTRSPAEVERFVARLRVSAISDQDDAGPWIRQNFPKLFYIVRPSAPNGNEYVYATWTGISGDAYYRNGEGADTSFVTNEWLDSHIRSKGELGKLYPRFLFIMEGDTPSFLGLLQNGLEAYRRPDWGGWGGRYLFLQPYGESHPIWSQGGDLFKRLTSQDTVPGTDGKPHTSDQATIWRWRAAFQNDFSARMDWTRQTFAHANHAPKLVVNGVPGTASVFVEAAANSSFTLDAAGSSDPDSNQHLTYSWFQYPEAGSADSNVASLQFAGEHTSRLTVRATSPCSPLRLPLLPCRGSGVAHLILAVTDDGTPPLTSYRRVVIHATP